QPGRSQSARLGALDLLPALRIAEACEAQNGHGIPCIRSRERIEQDLVAAQYPGAFQFRQPREQVFLQVRTKRRAVCRLATIRNEDAGRSTRGWALRGRVRCQPQAEDASSYDMDVLDHHVGGPPVC